MGSLEIELKAKANSYLAKRSLGIKKYLGHGEDGIVYVTDQVETVVKAFERQKNFLNELACYERFQDAECSRLCGFAIPQLQGFDEQLMIIEIGLVRPPYILDFGKVYLDKRPSHFSPETWADWRADFAERWGADWPRIQDLLRALESYGIYYMDPKPGNIALPGWNPTV
jgi:hypothetical protein